MDTRKKILDYERRHGLDLRLRRAFNQALLGAGASGTTIPKREKRPGRPRTMTKLLVTRQNCCDCKS